jgi:hypothetical protein
MRRVLVTTMWAALVLGVALTWPSGLPPLPTPLSRVPAGITFRGGYSSFGLGSDVVIWNNTFVRADQVGDGWTVDVSAAEPTPREPVPWVETDIDVTVPFVVDRKADLLAILRSLPPGTVALVGYVGDDGDAHALSEADLRECVCAVGQ